MFSCRRSLSPLSAILLSAGVLACSGSITSDSPTGSDAAGSGGAPGGAAGAGRGGAGPAQAACAAPPGPLLRRRIWRLTPEQAARTLQAIPEVGSAPVEVAALRDPSNGLFVNQPASLRIDFPDRFPTAEAWASKMATRLVTGVKARAGCAALDRACVSSFLDQRLARLWRRPVTGDERDNLLQVYAAVPGSNETKTQFTLQAALLSPWFWNRTELGDGDGSSKTLTSVEVASMISYGLANGPPDDALWADAIAGKLNGPAAVRPHVERLIKSGAHTATLVAFFRDWLDYKKLDEKDKVGELDMTAELKGALVQELSLFVTARAKGTGDLASYFVTPQIFPSAQTATIYGKKAPATDFAPVTTSSVERIGVLTLAGSLMATSRQSQDHNYIYRGNSFLAKFACAPTPPPPDNVVSGLQPGTDTSKLSSKQVKMMHSSVPSCAACHRTIDPVGLVFEGYDMMGRYRTTDDHGPIDTSGKFAVGNETFTFDNLEGFLRSFAVSSSFAACGTSRLLGYVLGAIAEATDPIDDLAFQGCGTKPLDLGAALVAAFTSDRALLRSE